MQKLFRRIWTELTRVREIQFISYETDQEMQERLSKEPLKVAQEFSKELGV